MKFTQAVAFRVGICPQHFRLHVTDMYFLVKNCLFLETHIHGQINKQTTTSKY